MDHLQSVTVIDEKRSHWVAKGPARIKAEWDAEIINEIPNELIGWRSTEGSRVDNAGSVHFTPAAGGRGTEVQSDPALRPAGRTASVRRSRSCSARTRPFRSRKIWNGSGS